MGVLLPTLHKIENRRKICQSLLDRPDPDLVLLEPDTHPEFSSFVQPLEGGWSGFISLQLHKARTHRNITNDTNSETKSTHPLFVVVG